MNTHKDLAQQTFIEWVMLQTLFLLETHKQNERDKVTRITNDESFLEQERRTR